MTSLLVRKEARMRLLGYVFCLLGIIIVIVANFTPFIQFINALVSLLTQLSQTALLYALSWQLTIGGLILLVIGLLLLLLAYRRYRQITVTDTPTGERLDM
jgi:hypothetical protein